MREAIDLLHLILSAWGPDMARRRLEAVRAELHEARQRGAAVDDDLVEAEAILAALLSLPYPEPAPSVETPLPALPPVVLPRLVHFLGRGVSGRLNDHRLDRARIEGLGLPLILSPADLADQLGISVGRLCWLAFHAEVATRIHYVHFQVPKRTGGFRTLSRPHQMLAGAQGWILDRILARLPVSAACHGFVAGRSIVSNARLHTGKDLVVNVDLENFFPSIGFQRVRKVFVLTGYSPAVATVLALLCTECPRRPVDYAGRRYWIATGPRGLPQGACTSPALSNQVALRLDRRLGGLAGRMGLAYSRYADDLTFSGPSTLGLRLGYFLSTLERIILDEGFALNARKTRILRQNTRQMVTGLVVNDRPSLPRRELRRLRAILHRARHEGLAAQDREGRPNFRAWLRGKIAYVQMARPDLGAKLLAELEALTAP